MHSSRDDFSSLHTQHGFTFAVVSPEGLRSEARFVGVEGISNQVSVRPDGEREEVNVPAIGTVATGEDENQPILDCGGRWEAWAQRGAWWRWTGNRKSMKHNLTQFCII
jgi:hypothetical protein